MRNPLKRRTDAEIMDYMLQGLEALRGEPGSKLKFDDLGSRIKTNIFAGYGTALKQTEAGANALQALCSMRRVKTAMHFNIHARNGRVMITPARPFGKSSWRASKRGMDKALQAVAGLASI